MKLNTFLTYILFQIIFINSLNINLFAKSKNYPTQEIKALIDIPQTTQTKLQFPVFFNGEQKLSDANGFITFRTNNNVKDISILICKNFEQNFEKNNQKQTNTVLENKINIDKNYKFLVQKKNNLGETIWEEQKLKNNSLPENCLIILMHPNIIDSISDWDISLPNKIIPLIKIKIKSDLSNDYLSKKANKAHLGSAIDARIFHKGLKEETQTIKKENTIEVQLAKPGLV